MAEPDGRVESGVESEGTGEWQNTASRTEGWMRSASDPGLSEEHALSMLNEAGLPGEVFEQLHKNKQLMKSRKVRMALVVHPKTPRHVSVPAIRQLFTFDLMNVALAPLAPADVKMAAEEALILKMETISSGERLSLARRASGRVAGALLLDAEARVVDAALENGRLTEALVAKAVVREDAPAHMVMAVCHHAKWSLRRDVRMALLRSEKTPLARAVEFARGLPGELLREILLESRLPESVREGLLAELAGRD
jgi:hypothetical protein